MAELKTKLDRGTYVKPTARTLGEYALEWLPRRERTDKGLRSTTVAGYEYYLREDIAPSALGRMKLTDVRRYHVQEFVDDPTTGRSWHRDRTAAGDAAGHHIRHCRQR